MGPGWYHRSRRRVIFAEPTEEQMAADRMSDQYPGNNFSFTVLVLVLILVIILVAYAIGMVKP